MMRKYFPAVLLVVATSLLFAGCLDNTFHYSFKDTGSLTDGTYTWGEVYGAYDFTASGIALTAGGISCPLKFIGDVDILVDFHADSTAAELASLAVSVWDGNYPASKLCQAALYLGRPEDQIYMLYEVGTLPIPHGGDGPAIPGYHGTGDYTLKISKRGDTYTFHLGSARLGSFKATDYIAGIFKVLIEGQYWPGTSAGSLVVRDVTIKYEQSI